MSCGDPSPLDIHGCVQLILLEGEHNGIWWPCLISSSFLFLEKVCEKVNYPLSKAAWTASFTSLCLSGYEANGDRVALLLGNPPSDRFLWETSPLLWTILPFDHCIQCSPSRNPPYFHAIGEAKSFLLPPAKLFGSPALDSRRLATSHPQHHNMAASYSNKRQKTGHHENGQQHQHLHQGMVKQVQELEQQQQQLEEQVLKEQQKLSSLVEQQQSQELVLKQLVEQQQSQEQVLEELEERKDQMLVSEEDLKQELLEHQHNQQRVLKQLDELKEQQKSKERVLKQLEVQRRDKEQALEKLLEQQQHLHQGMAKQVQELEEQLGVQRRDKEQALEKLSSLEQQQHLHQGMAKMVQELQEQLKVQRRDKEKALEKLSSLEKQLSSSERALDQAVLSSLQEQQHLHQGIVKQVQELEEQLKVQRRDKEQALEKLSSLEKQNEFSLLGEQLHNPQQVSNQLELGEQQHDKNREVLEMEKENPVQPLAPSGEPLVPPGSPLPELVSREEQLSSQEGRKDLPQTAPVNKTKMSVVQEPDTMDSPRPPTSLKSPGSQGTSVNEEVTQLTPPPVSVKMSCSKGANVPGRVSLSPPHMFHSVNGHPPPPP